MVTTLAQALPRARFSERHSLVIDNPPEQVWSALTDVRWRDLRVSTPLMLIRSLGRFRGGAGQRLLDPGPVSVMRLDRRRYAAAAAIGRPWRLDPERGPEPTDLQGLLDFDEPGWLKYGMDFTLQELAAGRTRITTTTLCEPTDDSARRRFRPYWTFIRPFSGLMRRDMLHTISRRAGQLDIGGPPPGQRVLMGPAPRFGLPRFVRADFTVSDAPVLQVAGLADGSLALDRDDLDALPSTTRELDLHCVMTWSVEGTRWTGWRFADLWNQLPGGHAVPATTELLFTGLDGAHACIPLAELLRDDVMVAHSCEGTPLTRAQGAPYRLVVPHLYGYKHVKHLCRIDLVDHHVRGPHEPWIMHRLGRVECEERHGLGMNRAVRVTNGMLVRRALRSYGVRDPRFR